MRRILKIILIFVAVLVLPFTNANAEAKPLFEVTYNYNGVKKAGAGSTTINEVNITGITIPIAGRTPDTSNIKFLSEGLTISSVEWLKESDNSHIMEASEKFVAKQRYILRIVFTVNNGYSLPEQDLSEDHIITNAKYLMASFMGQSEEIRINYEAKATSKVTISFDPNGGKTKTKTKTAITYSPYGTLPTPTKKGYTFTGWYTEKSGGTKVESSSEVDKEITLYAHWIKIEYNITYKLNGGTNNDSNPSSYYITSSKIKLKNPTRTGYIFAGWYKDAKFKSKLSTISKGSTGNKTLYAKWTPISYKVVFNKNGGNGKLSSQTGLKYNKSYTLKNNKFKRKGYSFVGWNTKANGTGIAYANKASIKNLSSKNGKTITLYAQWKKKTYTITYKLNGGTNNASNPNTYTITTATTALKNPTKNLYRFVGWYKDSKFKTKVTNIKKGSTGNITLYAKWAKINYACKGSFTKEVPNKNVTIGYSDHVNWTWSTGGIYDISCGESYRSANSEVATVDSNGIIKAIAKGDTYIYSCIIDKKTKTEIACFKGHLNVIEEDDNTTVLTPLDEIANKYVGRWYLEGYSDVGIIVQKRKYYYESLLFNPSHIDLASGEIYANYGSIEISYNNWDKNLENNNIKLDENRIIIESKTGTLIFTKSKGNIDRYSNNPLRGLLGKWYLFNKPEVNLDISIYGKYSFEELDLFNESVYFFKADYKNFDFNSYQISDNSGIEYLNINDQSTFDHMKIENDVLKILDNNEYTYLFYREPRVVELNEIVLDTNSLNLGLYRSYLLKATISPIDTYDTELVWTSSDSNVASVSSNGEVVAKSPGTATITVSNKKGNITNSCIVTVTKIDVESVQLNNHELNMYINSNSTLIGIVSPDNASYKDVIWESSNPEVATVTQNGEIHAIAKGDTTITITVVDGNKSDSCLVHVNYPPITAEVDFGISYITSSSGSGRYLYVKLTPSGGNGNYSNYKIKLYSSKNNQLLYESDPKASNEFYLSGVSSGSYYVEYEITDSIGNIGTGKSSTYTLSL